MRHEPHAVKRGVGALLSRAGIADRDLLRLETAAKGNGPKRLRAYLAGEGFADEGALALLREQAGFDVDIADEAGFWAAGRGWVDRFWDARLRLGVRGCEGAAASATESVTRVPTSRRASRSLPRSSVPRIWPSVKRPTRTLSQSIDTWS
jgi:hypothetical protein